MKAKLEARVLPEGKTKEPVSGLLYFPMEKQKMKAERRAQRKIAKNTEPIEGEAQAEILGQDETLAIPSESVPSEGEQ